MVYKAYLMFIALFFVGFAGATAQNNSLKRMVKWAYGYDFLEDKGILVARVDEGGTFEKIGIQKGDLLTSLNGNSLAISKMENKRIFNRVRDNDHFEITLLRDGKSKTVEGEAVGLKKQDYSEFLTAYHHLEIDGDKFRVIVKEPKGKALASVLYVPDFPCASIENQKWNSDGLLIHDLVRKGVAVFSVEKYGIGDNSTAKECYETSLQEDIGLYRRAYEFMQNHPGSKGDESYIFGQGTGAIIAQYLALDHTPKGIVLFGTNFKPWMEYLLDRLSFHAFLGRDDLLLTQNKKTVVKEVFHKVFEEGADLNVLAENPVYTSILEYYLNYDSYENSIMGRSQRFWQEVHQANIAENLKNVKSYVLSVKGSEDAENYVRTDHQYITDVVNTYNPGFSEFVEIDSLNHYYMMTPKMYDYYAIDNGVRPQYSASFSNLLVDWMKKTNRRSLEDTRVPAPRDISQINMKQLSSKIIGKATSTTEKVTRIIDWANTNLKWVATDYRKRSAKEIISRGGGNCNEEAVVVLELLNAANVKTRKIREINMQPDSQQRDKDAKQLIQRNGNYYSVFGLCHNDHIWIEFFDDESRSWQPADPTLNLVGLDAWIKARLGFEKRITHKIIASQDMLFPFAIFSVDENNEATLDRTKSYVVDGFKEIYPNIDANKKYWGQWKRNIDQLSKKGYKAFNAELNLHAYYKDMKRLKQVYYNLKKANSN